MDEVFDLREKNQWLRRQIVAVLRQLIKAMFGKDIFSIYLDQFPIYCVIISMVIRMMFILGDIVNRRIVDYFAQMTSPETLCSYLESFKQSLWPNGTYCIVQCFNW